MKSECEKLAVELSAYFDKELNGAQAAAVEAHLAGCADCRGDLEKMTRLRNALHDSGTRAAPETRLLQDLMQALRRPERNDGRELFEIGRNGPPPSTIRGR